jgi:hypothetical protein
MVVARSWMIRSLGSREAWKALSSSAFLVSSLSCRGMPVRSLDSLRSTLFAKGRPLASFRQGDRIRGASGMSLRPGYSYVLAEAPGSLPADFQPDLSPAEMLMLGVFEGRYLNDCVAEFPAEWFLGALMTGSLSPQGADPAVNLFKIKSRQPLSIWRQNRWGPSLGRRGRKDDHYHGLLGDPDRNPDERGWFQWYCRFWMGRRMPELDDLQIKRWRAFRRHAGGVRAGCSPHDLACRPRERQALLQWAYNPFI